MLLCANPLERYKVDLLELGVDEQQVDAMAIWFLIATLVFDELTVWDRENGYYKVDG